MDSPAAHADLDPAPGLGTPAHADGPSALVRAIVGLGLGLATGALAAWLIPHDPGQA